MTGKQRASLRKMANTLDTIIYIGKEGITDHVVKEVYETYLESYGSHKAHEILHTHYTERKVY